MIDNRKELREIRKNIGQNIHDIRKKKRMTLKKLSKLSHIRVNLLDQYEIGKNQIGLNSMMNIANSLEIFMKEFLNSGK